MPYGMNTILIFNSYTDDFELNNLYIKYYTGVCEVQGFTGRLNLG